MAYDYAKLSRAASLNNNRSLFTYVSSDSLTAIGGVGYFNGAADKLQDGDLIIISGGEVAETYTVTDITGGVVTISSGLATGAVPVGIAADAVYPGSLTRTVASKLADVDSILDIIPSAYHAAIEDGTNTVDLKSYFDAALLATTSLFVPRGVYLIKSTVNVPSKTRIHGVGEGSHIYNDRSAASNSKWACLQIGDHHLTAFPYYTAYACNAISARATTATVTSGDATGLSVGQLVHFCTAGNNGGVPYYGYITVIKDITSGVVTLADSPKYDMSDPTIYAIAGNDADLGIPWSIVSDVQVDNLGFTGRAIFGTKGAVYNFNAFNLWAINIHHKIAMNSVNKGQIGPIFGDYSGRKCELALNSRNVLVRDCPGAMKALQGSDARITPIHIAEQSSEITLRRLPVALDAGFTAAYRAAELKGLGVTVDECDWHHGGTSNQEVIAVPNSAYTGWYSRDILVKNSRISCGSGHSRLVLVGGSDTDAPRNVALDGCVLDGPVTSESMWFENGRGHAIINTNDLTPKRIKVDAGCEYPRTNGYRRPQS